MMSAEERQGPAGGSHVPQAQLDFTGERYVPSIHGEIELEHRHRYALAVDLARGKRVLDLACGEGYGSNMLADVAANVVGVDISSETVEHARCRYERDNLAFAAGSCAAIPLPDASIDLVVSFETLEHHAEHEEMMREVRRVLAPEGVLLISSPDKFEYSDVPRHANEFHVKELYRDEFRDLLARHFRHVTLYGQRIFAGSVVAPLGAEAAALKSLWFMGGRTHGRDGLFRPLYFIALASNSAPGDMPTTLFDGVEQLLWSREEIIQRRDHRIRELEARHEQDEAVRRELEAELQHLHRGMTSLREAIAAAKAGGESLEHERLALEHRLRIEAERLAALENDLGEARSEVNAERERARYAEHAVDMMWASTSWRLTAPVRALGMALRRPASGEGRLDHLGRALYRRVPLSPATRLQLKKVIFERFGWAFRSTAAYERWRAFTTRADEVPDAESGTAPAAVTPLPGNDVEDARTDSAAAEERVSRDEPGEKGGGEFDPAADAEEYVRLAAEIRAERRRAIEQYEPSAPHLIALAADSLAQAAAALQLPASEAPTVSIVIPVYNHVQLTLECLSSIARAAGEVDFEVIVMDDGSSDATEALLGKGTSWHYIRNPENLGFLRTCNRGFAAVRGRYIVILNNDVQVQPGWLEALLAPFTRFECVGIVGPKVLYANGRLQEAGARLVQDLSSQLIGVGEDPDQPRFSYAREVEYVSGACLALETSLLRELGGFDDAFAPAYCEDVDLCLRVRERGLRVIYNPEAVIVHHLSATSDAIDRGYKLQMAARNQQKLAERWQPQVDRLNDVRLIAFYLPQYHPIPENDLWWGKGFTEWTNVAKALPSFAGHYQPHVPADLGFYDLRLPEVMERQAELARRYGVHGFCYYYYWFAGRRLLEMPIERMLAEGRPELPFCLCWANENWTRRWDGLDSQVLVGQTHSDEDDLAVMRDLMRYFRDPRYIRIDGRPLLLVYRAPQFPDVARTARNWRDLCRAEGIGEIYLAYMETFDEALKVLPPSRFGFDASVEFPPHQTAIPMAQPETTLDPGFAGVVSDYRRVAMEYLKRVSPAHTRFRGVMPSWDNTPRHESRAYVFHHASPGAYQAWLEAILDWTREQNFGDERIVFVNAWNEWAEGTHLEPDCRFGHGWLEATRNALRATLFRARA